MVQYLERSFLLLVTSASDLPVCTIWLCSVVFGVTSSLAVIHTIHGRPWLHIARGAWSSDTRSQEKPVAKCDAQQLPIAEPDIR